MTLLSEALEYARRGWYVFPCREKPGQPYERNGETITPMEKEPYISNGLNAATLDEDQITAWWNRWQNALIGVNAGKSGLFVLDIDKKHVNGLDTFTQWGINDSAGLHSRTPSGGLHFIFTGSGKSSTNGKTGIDTRGEGGYFIVPPSEILEGRYVGKYEKLDDNWGKVPGIIPDGLMSKLFPDNTVEYVRGKSEAINGLRLLSRATLDFQVNGAIQGDRNNAIFRACADYAGCGYTKEQTDTALYPVSQKIGITRSEFVNVIDHAFSKARTPSIPDSIQEKIMAGGKDVASKITPEEETIIEYAILACLLIDNNLIPVVMDILTPNDLQTLRNRMIYRAILRLYNLGMKVDLITVTNEVLKETDKVKLDEVSAMINQYYISTDNTFTYAHIIREKASIRKIETLMDNKAQYMKKGTLVDIVSELEKDLSDIAIYGGAKTSNVLTSEQAVEGVKERIKKMANGEIGQLKTGFIDYDFHVGGLFSDELVIVAGRAGEGKYALSLSLANHIALVENKPVGYFSLEMSTHDTICRLISQITGIPFRKVYQGKMNQNEWKMYEDATAVIEKSPFHFDDGVNMTVPELRSKIRKLAEKDISLIVIDQLEQIKGYEGQPPHIQFDKICYDIKNITKEFNVPVILNHQLNRNSTNRQYKNPELVLSDLNQAGEKAANQVWAIAHQKDEKTGKILKSKIKMLKNRNGPAIEFAVIYIGERMLFSNPVREEDKQVFHGGASSNNGDDYDDDNSDPHWSRR